MPGKSRRPIKRQALSNFDISLDPLFTVGKGEKQTRASAADILLHQQFKDALAGKPKGVAAMLKILKINERERGRSPAVEAGLWSSGKERKGKTIINADAALQLLGIATKYWDKKRLAFGIEPWVVELAEERSGISARESSWWLSPHLRPEDAQPAEPYSLATDPAFSAPKPKRPAEATRFHPGKSGNPGGRPRQQKVELPFDGFLNELGSIVIEGETRQCTRLEALFHQANLRAIKGDEALAPLLSSAYVEERYARWKRRYEGPAEIVRGEDEQLDTDPFHSFLLTLRLLNRRLVRRALLEPWIVEAALGRMGERQLNVEEQKVVVRSTSTPQKVAWPDWWEVRSELRQKRS